MKRETTCKVRNKMPKHFAHADVLPLSIYKQ